MVQPPSSLAPSQLALNPKWINPHSRLKNEEETVLLTSGWGLDVIYQTRATVFHRDIQTPRRELKIRRAAEYF